MNQSLETACSRFVDWLDEQVTATGRGDNVDRLDLKRVPESLFWLGLLYPEDEAVAEQERDRTERLKPCAIGVRLRPRATSSYRFQVVVSLRLWRKTNDFWVKSERITARVPVDFGHRTTFGDEITAAIRRAGGARLSAEIRVEREQWHGDEVLLVQLVNTSPSGLRDVRPELYEVALEIDGLETEPFVLEKLPDAFRYDREIPAFGENCGVEFVNGVIRTTDTIIVDRGRPDYDVVGTPTPVLTFERLAESPLEELHRLVELYEQWVGENWSDAALRRARHERRWDDELHRAAIEARDHVMEEVDRLHRGISLLYRHRNLIRAFQLMNRAMAHSARRADGSLRYRGWRPFQIGFLLATLPAILGDGEDRDVVDTVWFATGGGKTETYLGLLVTAALYERMNGRRCGVTAWSRFPLRMLSLQQTQRFANALAGAELIRREEGIDGDPFSLGFLMGGTSTPNRIRVEKKNDGDFDIEDDDAPKRHQVLLECPFCHHESVGMKFQRRLWKLEHRCSRRGEGCPWPEEALPMYVVDDEIFRFLPTVVVGTLDKAAIVSMQTGMRGLVGAPIGYCPGPSHGHTYASRSEFPQGCLVPGCEREPTPLPQSAEMYGMTFRLQDELHLLRDSLGAVDSHYEGLLDEMQRLLVGHRPKVVASSATLTGYERQVEVLYQRSGRVFPQKGLDVTRSYWSSDADPAQQPERLLRRFVAVSPRGATHEFVHDRTVEALQRAIRRLVEEREDLCVKLGIEPVHVQKLIDLYGVDVVYGTTLRDVEAAQRSFDTQIQTDPPVKSAALTGRTPLEEVRRVLTELESPPEAFEERLHLVAASSMLSHGVDVERFNVMVMIGLPLTTAEFIQTTARVGRRYPGLVYVLHRVARERDAAIFRQFGQFIRQGDRFVEPIPVTRRSRRVLDVTLPGLAEARRVQFHEPRSRGRLTTVKNYVAYLEARGKREEEFAALLDMLGVEKDQEPELARHVEDWVDRWWHSVEHPPATARFPSDLLPDEEGPMQSLRDVEQTVPVVD